MEFVILLFLISAFAFIYINYKDRRRKGSEIIQGFDATSEGLAGIKTLGFVEPGILGKEPEQITQNAYMNLKQISSVFKYSDSNDYWIRFELENNTFEDITFVLDSVAININGSPTPCSLSLLCELAPATMNFTKYDNYFDTIYYNNYTLGKAGQKTFKFQSRFSTAADYKISGDDFVEIRLCFNKRKISYGYVIVDRITFRRNFRHLEIKSIQLKNETLTWETRSE